MPTPLVVVCAGGMRNTLLLLLASAFALGSSEVAVGFFGLFVSFVQNLPQLLRQVVIFSPIEFLCDFVARREVCPGASFAVLQQKGPGSQPVRAVWVWNFFLF